MEELLRIWRTKRKIIASWNNPACAGIVYQLDRCILDLESELEHEAELRRNSVGTTALVESRNKG